MAVEFELPLGFPIETLISCRLYFLPLLLHRLLFIFYNEMVFAKAPGKNQSPISQLTLQPQLFSHSKSKLWQRSVKSFCQGLFLAYFSSSEKRGFHCSFLGPATWHLQPVAFKGPGLPLASVVQTQSHWRFLLPRPPSAGQSKKCFQI